MGRMVSSFEVTIWWGRRERKRSAMERERGREDEIETHGELRSSLLLGLLNLSLVGLGGLLLLLEHVLQSVGSGGGWREGKRGGKVSE